MLLPPKLLEAPFAAKEADVVYGRCRDSIVTSSMSSDVTPVPALSRVQRLKLLQQQQQQQQQHDAPGRLPQER
jgi:hypothetical protein